MFLYAQSKGAALNSLWSPWSCEHRMSSTILISFLATSTTHLLNAESLICSISKDWLEILNFENQRGSNIWQCIRVVSKAHFVLTELYPVDMLKGEHFPALLSLI
jgi:hypothetical protein